MILWLTGNTGARKTTVARKFKTQQNTVILDGDELRQTLSAGLGLSLEDRLEHNVRVARLARQMEAQGLTVIVAVIAPTRKIRDMVREICGCVFIHMDGGADNTDDTPYEAPGDDEVIFRVMG